MQGYQQVSAAFGEDGTRPEELFGYLAAFVVDFERALKENHAAPKS
jgi:hypothetical protein